MRDKVFTLLIFLCLVSCSEEDLPDGLYDYQVERLLSGQSGTKMWSQQVNSTNCSDSVFLLFVSSSDSLDISRIVRSVGCASFDTTLIGRANAASVEGIDLFSDSLIFSSGSHWIVNGITSQQMQLTMDVESLNYLVE
ncbi:MAG: hypothetical protein ABJG47_18145 [Ekhidna sp.]